MDFKSRVELLAYVERRVIVDVDRYARFFLNMGDVFHPDPYGVYNLVTGDCIADFGKSPYTLYNGQKKILSTWDDYDDAKGNIYTHDGYLTLSARNIKRTQVTDNRPILFKAKEAAISYFCEVLEERHDYVNTPRNIKQLDQVAYRSDIENSTRMYGELMRLESLIASDITNNFENDTWRELYLASRNGTFMVDVGLDVRIKDYYLRRFDRIDQERELQDESEYDGRSIRNS